MRGVVALSAAIGLAGAGAKAASRAATRRWVSNPDPTGGAEFAIAGTERTVIGYDGVALHTVSVGSGHPVVLAPGWSGHCADWAPVANLLTAEGYRVITYDRRGHGRSSLGHDGFTLTSLGLDLRTIIDSYAIADATLVGHSLGGVAALMFVTDHAPAASASISNLVLVSTTAHWSTESPISASVPTTSRSVGFDHRPVVRSVVGSMLARPFFGNQPNQRLMDHGARRLSEMEPRTLVDLLGVMTTLDVSDQLASVGLATRVVCGTEDRITPMSGSELLAVELPNAELWPIDGCGHMMPWERPGAVVEAVRANAKAKG